MRSSGNWKFITLSNVEKEDVKKQIYWIAEGVRSNIELEVYRGIIRPELRWLNGLHTDVSKLHQQAYGAEAVRHAALGSRRGSKQRLLRIKACYAWGVFGRSRGWEGILHTGPLNTTTICVSKLYAGYRRPKRNRSHGIQLHICRCQKSGTHGAELYALVCV